MMQSQDPSWLPREVKPESAVVVCLWAHRVLKVFQQPSAVLTGRQLSRHSPGIVPSPSPAFSIS